MTEKKFVAIKTVAELTPKQVEKFQKSLSNLSDEFEFALVRARIKLH